MRVVNQQVPTPFRDIDLGTLLRPNLLEFAQERRALPLHAARRRARARRRSSARSRRWTSSLGLAEGLPVGRLLRLGHRALHARRCSATPTAPTTSALLEHELYLAATDLDTCERIVFGAERLGRRPDLDRRARVDRAADGLQAGQGPRPRAHRRRHRLDHQPRHRRRGGREVRRRGQPARALRQRLHRARSRRLLGSRPRARQRHGPPADRLPGVQADGLPAPARDGAPVGAALPGRRHRADRARARRRADVPDVDHELHRARRHRPPRLRVGHAASSPRTTTTSARSASATASRSPRRACARSSSTSRPSRRRRAPGARSSSRRRGSLLRQSSSEA